MSPDFSLNINQMPMESQPCAPVDSNCSIKFLLLILRLKRILLMAGRREYNAKDMRLRFSSTNDDVDGEYAGQMAGLPALDLFLLLVHLELMFHRIVFFLFPPLLLLCSGGACVLSSQRGRILIDSGEIEKLMQFQNNFCHPLNY